MPEVTVHRSKTFMRLSWRARFRLWWRRLRMPPTVRALEDELIRRELDAIVFGDRSQGPASRSR